MLRWIRRKLVEIVYEAFNTARKDEISDPLSLQNSLDDYADHQIAWLLRASAEYRKAKKDPEAFVEKYFSEKIQPVKPYVDSWVSDTLDVGLRSEIEDTSSEDLEEDDESI